MHTGCHLGDRSAGPRHLGLESLTKNCQRVGLRPSLLFLGAPSLAGAARGAHQHALEQTASMAAPAASRLTNPWCTWQVATLAEGREWSLESSPAQNWTPPQPKMLPSTTLR